MNINRMADEKMAPSWVFDGDDAPEFSDAEYIMGEESQRIRGMESELSDDALISERERIDHCASSGSLYHYSSKWDDGAISSLREYAVVCGMDMEKFKGINPEAVESYEKEIIEELDNEKAEVKAMLNDPFKLDEKADTSHMDKANWQDVTKQSELADKPSMEGSVRPLRGGEDYSENSYSQTARGQNSITDPDAIETYANSDEEDTGERLRRENEEKAQSKEVHHKEWQDEKVAAMDGSEIIPKGGVFATEVMNAQPGIRGEVFDFDSVPEKTAGEKISEANEDRRKEIQGSDKEDHEFKPEKAPARGISDSFASELKKFVK